MQLTDPRREIAQIEAELERLSDSAERCRKLAILGRVAAWAGGVLLPLTLLGILPLGPAALILEITALVGGIVLAGSNRRTHDDLLAAIAAGEARRAALIDALPLQDAASVD